MCKWHPNAKLKETKEFLPDRSNVNVDEPNERTILRCSVVVDEATGRLCPFVDVLYDGARRDPLVGRLAPSRGRWKNHTKRA